MKTNEQLTLADLPARLADRAAKPACICRCVEDRIDELSNRAFYERVRDLNLALVERGLRAGDKVAIMSESRPEWVMSDLAAQACGAVTVPIYSTQAPDQVLFILRQAEVKLVVASTLAQVQKIRQVRAGLPALETVVLIEGDQAPIDGVPVVRFDDVLARGQALSASDPAADDRFRRAAAGVDRGALATIVYTSGTTGEPKGVMLTHANIMSNLLASVDVLTLAASDVALSFLPLSHVFERLVMYRFVFEGTSVYFAEGLATVARDLLRVRPTVMTGVPRVYEKFYATIHDKVASGPAVRRALFKWAVGVGRARSQAVLDGRQPSLGTRIAHPIADHLVLAKVRERVGGRFRFLVSGSAPLPRHIGEFFHAVGLTIIEGYGLTESSPAITLNPLDRPRFGTVGVTLPGVEVKIAPDGEILARGPNIMAGYYKRPDLTAQTIRDGWLLTGDIGIVDADGYLTITDRKKDLIVTSGGKKIAPQPLENLLKSDPLVAEIVLLGEQRKFPAALVVPNFATLEARARALHIDPADRAALVRRPEILALYQELLDRLNVKLAQFERIKRFVLLPTEFTMERGELTPTMKVRRQVIEERYRDLIEEMFAPLGGEKPE